MPLRSVISVMYPLCGLALPNTTDNQSEMCPLKLSDFCLFCTIDHTQSYKGRLFPLWLSQVVMTGLETTTPRWDSQHSNHAATPTCLVVLVATSISRHLKNARTNLAEDTHTRTYSYEYEPTLGHSEAYALFRTLHTAIWFTFPLNCGPAFSCRLLLSHLYLSAISFYFSRRSKFL